MKLISDQVSQKEIGIILQELEKVIVRNISGEIVEFGCYIGTTSLSISEYLKIMSSNKVLHVYDSFDGLPDKSDKDLSPAGEQFKPGELAASKSQFINNYRQAHLPLPVIHKGWFENLQATDLPDRIAFAFLDGDYFVSIQASLKLVWPKLSANGRVVVDDYANEALPGVQKAIDEWLTIHHAKMRVEASLAILTPK